MKQQYRYILEKSSKKYYCPNCNKKRFVRYIDTKTNNYLPEKYGRCDRESKCGYSLNPYTDGYAKENAENIENNYITKQNYTRVRKAENIKPVFIPNTVLKSTLEVKRYEQNVFIQNLLNTVNYPFKPTDIEKVISLYYLGTVVKGYRSGAVTFPFIDIKGNTRAIQVKQFDRENHTTGTDFLHSIIKKHCIKDKKPVPEWLEAYNRNDIKVSCLFGEHLLSKYPYNPIALVEAPKTAIYGTLYFGFPEILDNLIWVAVYSKSTFTIDRLKILKGRRVIIFPDLSEGDKTFKEWKDKVKNFEKQLGGTKFIFSDLLEKLAQKTDRINGNDIADYLIKLNWQTFRQ
ncbi:MAG: hypothetical protein BM557_09875 [Flavobacterium sp. MedPE-SWcel]|uniref:DUF6371 domain-containing protein n=1 Tax=uncultured Flavobacterium sp. TaxID=165435 RepID=UPI0009214BE2|nr:DUF6371 domain-containing protein [uncultured Flavobacterium sp.]OIQ16610.1 MAG: hypothetical protein BM557_09875 [Flavobacterium sp. MedPE-SWcel]